MPYRTVTRSALTAAGFSDPAQANSFYGVDDNNHIHLGVPTQAGSQIAPAGEYFVTFISIKMDGYTAGRLEPGSDGRFWLDQMTLKIKGNDADWPKGYKDKLREALGPTVNL